MSCACQFLASMKVCERERERAWVRGWVGEVGGWVRECLCLSAPSRHVTSCTNLSVCTAPTVETYASTIPLNGWGRWGKAPLQRVPTPEFQRLWLKISSKTPGNAHRNADSFRHVPAFHRSVSAGPPDSAQPIKKSPRRLSGRWTHCQQCDWKGNDITPMVWSFRIINKVNS